MKKLSFLVEHLGPNQVSLLLSSNIEKFCEKNREYDICVFYDKILANSFQSNFCMLPSSELVGYDGTCISFGFNMAKKLITTPSVKQKIHFAFDFDWSFGLYTTSELEHVYKNQLIRFGVRNENYAKSFENAWGVKPYIFGDIDVRQISEIISGRFQPTPNS